MKWLRLAAAEDMAKPPPRSVRRFPLLIATSVSEWCAVHSLMFVATPVRWFAGRAGGTTAVLVTLMGLAGASTPARREVWHDPLTTAAPAAVVAARENRGGEFGAAGWRMREPRGFLRVTLPVAASREGELEVAIAGLGWASVGRAVGVDRKIHFLNLFSNPNGDHHAEDGGTADDALWTLRAGTDAEGGGRYGGDLKLLWASRGAKRTPGSDYHEQRLRLPTGFAWRAEGAHVFRVRWSARARQLTVLVDDREFARVPWRHDGAPLRYVFLGGAADFHALMGPVFSALKIYELAPP